MYKFEVDKQVVCIRDDWNWADPGDEPVGYPVLKCVYTIYDIGKWENTTLFHHISDTYLILHELSKCKTGRYAGFDASFFRPAKDTSIESLQGLLITPPLKIKENV